MGSLFSSLIGYLGQFFEFVHRYITYVVPDKNISYGLAIILFTLIIRLILLPLNIKQMMTQFKTTEIQPLLKQIQTKYKDNPTKLNEETMKLYKEKGVNPFGGCLPLLIQMPILMALYWVFKDLKGIQGISFLWISDLAKPDKLFILPILSGITQYLSAAIMTIGMDKAQAKQTSTMNIGMSIFIVFVSWTISSSLVLYWVFNNVYSMLQTWLMLMMRKKPEDNVLGAK